MQNFNIATKFGFNIELYPMVLDNNTQATIPTGIVSVKPFGVMIVDAALANTGGVPDSIASVAWSVDGNNAPLITATFTNSLTQVYCTVAVLYKP